ASEALNLLSVLEPDGYAFLACHLETLERPGDSLLDERKRTGGADVRQVGSHASAVAANGMAVRATGLRAAENPLAGFGISRHVIVARRARHYFHVCHQVPGIFIRQAGGWHVGARQTLADGAVDRLV